MASRRFSQNPQIFFERSSLCHKKKVVNFKKEVSTYIYRENMKIYATCLMTILSCHVAYGKEGLSSEVGRTFRLLEKSVSDAVGSTSSDLGCPVSEVSGVCSSHGSCRDGVCVCEEGYSSFDCSVRGCPSGTFAREKCV